MTAILICLALAAAGAVLWICCLDVTADAFRVNRPRTLGIIGGTIGAVSLLAGVAGALVFGLTL